jgi:malate dehydrogenase
MIDVAIIGAGELGGAIAHVLARRQIVRRIDLIDPAGQVAAGKALDILQTGPVERFTTRVSGSTDISRVAGATVVIVADAAKPGADADPLLPLRQITQLAARSIVIAAAAEHRSLVERGVRELRFARHRLFGSAPEALAASVRAIVALQTNASVKDVALTVLGAPPAHAVVTWDEATIGGFAATRVLDEPTRRRIAAQVGPLWPPGAHGLSHAAAEAVSAICGVSRRALSCFVAPDDSGGQRNRTIALPVRLDGNGVTAASPPTLSVAAQVALDNAMLL